MIRAYVTEDLLGMAVRISIVQQPDGGNAASILRAHDDPARFRWEPIEDSSVEVQPTLTLQRDEARAMLDSLTRLFQGAEDTRALRKDYDAERARVDVLARALVDVTTNLTTPPLMAARDVHGGCAWRAKSTGGPSQ
jgi:hypothetical protein